MKCSSTEDCSLFRRDAEWHPRRRHHGPFLRYLLREHPMNRDMRHGHYMHHEMRHGHHMQHEMRYDQRMHHRMDHGHSIHHEIGQNHLAHHKMGNDPPMYRRQHGPFMHHTLDADSMHHKMGYSQLLQRQQHGPFMHHPLGDDPLQYTPGEDNGVENEMAHGHARHHKMFHDQDRHHNWDDRQRHFPEFLQRAFERQDRQGEKRKLHSEGTPEATMYEPKSKVQVTRGNNKFQICLDISHYQPEEVKVKIVKDKIDISATHESMEDDLYEFHEMYRSFRLPEDVDCEKVSSRLNSDGKLIVEAPINIVDDSSTERDVPVTRLTE